MSGSLLEQFSIVFVGDLALNSVLTTLRFTAPPWFRRDDPLRAPSKTRWSRQREALAEQARQLLR